uniref:Uncharacterized protein n=1 Tax=Timema cristinae TaxID=61476 RepID=A0A7R9H2S3_TIMCR|nr:unnamed protein product [Timema cristinae]
MLLGAIPHPEEGLPPGSTVGLSNHNTQSFLPLQITLAGGSPLCQSLRTLAGGSPLCQSLRTLAGGSPLCQSLRTLAGGSPLCQSLRTLVGGSPPVLTLCLGDTNCNGSQQVSVQDPHWYPQQTSAMEQQGGNDPWSWGTSSHNHYSSEPIPSPAPTNCDPWNWGWDESNNNKTMSDKNTDPTWDWPAEDTTYHTETQDFVPMYGYTDNTSAPQGYTDNGSSSFPGQVSQHGYIGQPGSYVFHQPQDYDHFETQSHTKVLLKQLAAGLTMTLGTSLKQITHQGAVETAGSRTNHDTTQTDHGRLDIIKPEAQTFSPLSYESQGHACNNNLHVRCTSLEQSIDTAECEGEPAPPGSTSDLQEGLIVSRGPEGLPSQWSTESLPSQGSDGNQSDVSQQQDSRAYQYGAYEYHPDQTVGPPQLVYSPELSAMEPDTSEVDPPSKRESQQVSANHTHRHPPLKANPSPETVFHNNSSFAEQYKAEEKNPLERSSIRHYQECRSQSYRPEHHGPQDSSGHWYPRGWTHDIRSQDYQIRGNSTQGTSIMHRPIGPHQYTPQDQGPIETSVQQHASDHHQLEVRPQQYMPQGQGLLETSVQQHASDHHELEVRPQQYMPQGQGPLETSSQQHYSDHHELEVRPQQYMSQGQGPLETSSQQHPLSHPHQELEMRPKELTPKGQCSQETDGHHNPSSHQGSNIRSRQRQGPQEVSDMGAIFVQSDLGETRVSRLEVKSHSRGTKMGYVENEEIVPPEKSNVVVVGQSQSLEDINLSLEYSNTLTDDGNTNTRTLLGEVSTDVPSQGVCLGLTPAAPNAPSPPSDVKQGPPPPGDVRQGISSTGETTNPYKLGPSSHKHTNRFFHSPAQFLDPGVNLETVPDNKEHPDCVGHNAVERRDTSPLVRHTEPVGQDATLPLIHRPQQTPSYSASPENMEVAPRCGPDRNQYLETGQLTEEEPPSFQRLVAGGAEDTKRDEVLPPPGLRRMVPGESSSPESSANVFQPIEPRVVTGVDTQSAPSPLQVPRIKSECPSPVPETTSALPQPPSERSETIGSDNVDLFQPTSAAIADNHRENIGRREEPVERDVVVPTRRRDYYNPREHEGDDSPGRENRGQYDVVGDMRGSPQSNGRYRDERERSDPRRDVRRSTRSKRSYNRVDDEDEDTEEYYSDRDRVGRAYRDDYDRRYKGRADKNRERPQHRGHDKVSPRDSRERLVQYNPDMAREVSTVQHRHGKRGYNYYGRQVQGYPYSAYYGYDLKYLEDLRRANPVLYADYYAKYLSPQAVAQGSYTEDRGSVHSGRSSANEERASPLPLVPLCQKIEPTVTWTRSDLRQRNGDAHVIELQVIVFQFVLNVDIAAPLTVFRGPAVDCNRGDKRCNRGDRSCNRGDRRCSRGDKRCNRGDRRVIAIETGVIAIETGVIVIETGVVTEETSIVTEETGVVTEETSVVTEETGVVTEETGVVAEETSIVTEKTSVVTEETSIVTEETGVVTEETGVVAEETSVVTEETGVIAIDRRVIAIETGVIAIETGVIAIETGVIVIETGVVTEETGVIAIETGVIAIETWTLVIQSVPTPLVDPSNAVGDNVSALVVTSVNVRGSRTRVVARYDELLYRIPSPTPRMMVSLSPIQLCSRPEPRANAREPLTHIDGSLKTKSS